MIGEHITLEGEEVTVEHTIVQTVRLTAALEQATTEIKRLEASCTNYSEKAVNRLKRIEQLEAAIQGAICRLDDVGGTSFVSYDLENVLARTRT